MPAYVSRARRCIVPADGFYEWRRTGGKKQPFYFRMRDEGPFGFAGLWDRWSDADGGVLESCAILTTEANELVRPVHDRMRVILHPDEYDLWLDPDERRHESRRELLRPLPAAEVMTYPVSTRITSPSSRGETLIERLPINSAGA